MSNSAIPKEDQDTYKSFEFTDFSSNGHTGRSAHGTPSRHKNNTGIVLPTAAQLQEIQQQAHNEGYQAGYAEGAQRMANLLNTMEQALQKADQHIAQDLLNLSLEVARQMVQQTLKTHPEILLNTIREAINSLPHFNQGAHLVLHPDDATRVRASIGEQLSHTGWKIFEDALITPGGVRIETAHSQIDATLENRWQRIVASIGQDSSWIPE
jgi:flagellar assembly protein FliH